MSQQEWCLHTKESEDMWHLTVDRHLLSWARSQGFPHFRGNIHDSIRKVKKKEEKNGIHSMQSPLSFPHLVINICCGSFHLWCYKTPQWQIWTHYNKKKRQTLINNSSFLWYSYIIRHKEESPNIYQNSHSPRSIICIINAVSELPVMGEHGK